MKTENLNSDQADVMGCKKGAAVELNTIHLGDCLKHLIELKSNSVDYTITSPPYNLGTVKGKSKYQNTKDNYSQQDYFEWSKKVIGELIRVSKGEVFYNIQMLSNNKVALCKILGEFAEFVKEVIVWDKKNGEPAIEKGVMNSVWEFVIVFSKQDADKRKFYNAKFHGTFDNILRHKKQSGNEISELNAATFPIDLVRKLLLNFTNESELILDPFMGSGTTAIACMKEKRNFIGYELDEQIFNYANKRIENALSQTSLF